MLFLLAHDDLIQWNVHLVRAKFIVCESQPVLELSGTGGRVRRLQDLACWYVVVVVGFARWHRGLCRCFVDDEGDVTRLHISLQGVLLYTLKRDSGRCRRCRRHCRHRINRNALYLA